MSIKKIQENLSWVDLIFTVSGGLVWLYQPDQIFFPLTLMVLPKFFLLVFKKFYKLPWHYFVLIFIFLSFSAVSAVNSYQPYISWKVFAWTVGAVMMFFTLAGQPKEHFPVLIRLLLFSGTCFAILMFLSNDLSQINPPSRLLQFLNWKWMQIRPVNLTFYQDTDFISGYFALTLPLGLAILIQDIRNKKRLLGSITASSLGINILGLLVLAEYDAWVGLVIGLVFVLFLLAFNLSRKKFGMPNTILIFISILCLVTLILFLIPIGNSENLLIWTVEKAGFSDRLEMATNTVQLLRDYPYLGSGWNSFSGIYSKYMLLIPYHYTDHSHNLFLNLALELGLTGFTFLFFFFLITFTQSVKPLIKGDSYPENDLFQLALIWSWGVLFMHWVTEDPLYGSVFLISLFLIPGLSAAYSKPQDLNLLSSSPGVSKTSRIKFLVPLSSGLMTVLLIIIFIHPLISVWYANIGVIKLAKLELKGWPDNAQTIENLQSYSEINSLFENAIIHDTNNITATYHFGILNLDHQNFTLANSQFKQIVGSAPKHRGIIKALGYSYAWTGDVFNAAKVLEKIPEASYELSTYSWWWQTQGRDDLADFATKTESILNKNP